MAVRGSFSPGILICMPAASLKSLNLSLVYGIASIPSLAYRRIPLAIPLWVSDPSCLVIKLKPLGRPMLMGEVDQCARGWRGVTGEISQYLASSCLALTEVYTNIL